MPTALLSRPPAFVPNPEVSELVVIERAVPLAFAPEASVVARYFSRDPAGGAAGGGPR